MNPSIADELNNKDAPAPSEDKGAPDEQVNQLSALLQNSALLKSYESLMQELEADNERKQKQIS